MPGSRNDFIMAGDIGGSMVGFKGGPKPGGAKVPKSLADEVLEGFYI